MSWIHKHWDREYIGDAEAKVRQTVSLRNIACKSECDRLILYQMMEYRQAIAEAAGEPPVLVPAVPSNSEVPAYMSLASQYGIDDDMDIGDSTTRTQTTEQEYQSYITAPLSSKNINIIKFWEVSDGVNLMAYVSFTETTCRSTALFSPLYS